MTQNLVPILEGDVNGVLYGEFCSDNGEKWKKLKLGAYCILLQSHETHYDVGVDEMK